MISKETRIKMSEAKMGKKHCMYGKHWDPEVRRNMAIGHGGRPFTISKDEVVLEEFVSQAECAKKYDLLSNNISACLKGRRPHTGGYVFKYIHDWGLY